MRTQQIFINLISNAIKFSKPLDKIRVSIDKPSQVAQHTWQFAFKVTDEGMGLNDEDRKNLFTPYFRSSCAKNREANTNSHGIGLNFSKKLAKALNGDLSLDPEYRNGCQFVLKLNLKRIVAQNKQAKYKIRGKQFGKKKEKKNKYHQDIAVVYERSDESEEEAESGGEDPRDTN